MSREYVTDALNKIFCDIFDDETIRINDETTAKDIEGWDSLAQINLIVQIEKEFKIKFNLNEVEALARVGNIVDIIIRKIN